MTLAQQVFRRHLTTVGVSSEHENVLEKGPDYEYLDSKGPIPRIYHREFLSEPLQTGQNWLS